MDKGIIWASAALAIIVLAAAGCLGVAVEELDEPVDGPKGGQRDGNGCLGPAGYSYQEDIGACGRSWELTDPDIKKAAKIAADATGPKEGLTVVSVIAKECTGCYDVEFDIYGKRVDVSIEGWEPAL